MPRYYLGIDGGQSSTVALIADETGRVLGQGLAGPCNHVTADAAAQKFKAVIGECIARAWENSGLQYATVAFAGACLGFSGGPEDKQSYVQALIPSRLLKVTHDAEIALSGATAGKPGIIVIAGTGSIAFGRNGDGATGRAGGWGYIFGDEGGAFDLTRQALRAALQFEEGWGPPTTLREMLLAATESPHANTLLHRFYGPAYPRSRVASLAPLVDRAATAGDQVALKILDEAASKLAWLAEGVHGGVFRSQEPAAVSFIGGVFQSVRLLQKFSSHVLQSIGSAVVPPLLSPVAGALLEAFRLDGVEGKLTGIPDPEK